MFAIRFLSHSVADGAHNMAADETLLEAAGAGVPSLRLYGWSSATVSLGYFQSTRARLDDERLAPLPCVRRPSGGMTLVHHHELTYALALPARAPWNWKTGKPWLCRMHDIIADALRALGVVTAAAACATPRARSGLASDSASALRSQHVTNTSSLCFQHVTTGDLLLGEAKVVGSAQRRQRGALLQHGAILLASSPHAPDLAGILELTGRHLNVTAVADVLMESFTGNTGWPLKDADWSPAEKARIDELVLTKYGQSTWNDRR